MTLLSLPNDSQNVWRCQRRQIIVFENIEDRLEIKRRSWEARMTQDGKKFTVIFTVYTFFLDFHPDNHSVKTHTSTHKQNMSILGKNVHKNWWSLSPVQTGPITFAKLLKCCVHRGWSQNQVRVSYLYNVALLTPSLPSIFTDEFSPTDSYDSREHETC